jgi:YesN/AraC family two-component response regulator
LINVSRKKHGVLIADDYEADRFFLKETIRLHAPLLEVVGEVADGDEVIAYLWGYGEYADREKHPLPELLIMDVRMPRMTGVKVVEWLKTQAFQSLKVALLADSSAVKFRDQVLSLGTQHFYSKSPTLGDLANVVKKLQAELENEKPHPTLLQPPSIPPLTVDDLQINAHGMPVRVLWSNRESTGFLTVAAAKTAILTEYHLPDRSRARHARLFTWDGIAWKQTFF